MAPEVYHQGRFWVQCPDFLGSLHTGQCAQQIALLGSWTSFFRSWRISMTNHKCPHLAEEQAMVENKEDLNENREEKQKLEVDSDVLKPP